MLFTKPANGGNTWTVKKFNGDGWMYTSYYFKDGKIWIGGSDNYIHYSPDYGESWIKKQKPFVPFNRVYSIFMVDELTGIAGGLSNGLALTTDGWITTKQLETPLDQGKFSILKQS